MMSTISTISAFVAALSLVNAAPVAQSSSSSSSSVSIKVQLAGFDAASTEQAALDKTTAARNTQITEAEVNQQGPWCAAFSDSAATRHVKAVNGDGIFDSANPAIYSEDSDRTVSVASYWCAATRREVENFVARAAGGNNGGNNGNNGGNNNNNGNGNGNGNDNNNAAPATVRVQIETESGTTFVQDELPANVGLSAFGESRFFSNEVFSVEVVGNGNCQFFSDYAGQRAAVFPGTVGSFRCSA